MRLRRGGGAAESYRAARAPVNPRTPERVTERLRREDVPAQRHREDGTQAADYLGAVNQEKHVDLDQAWRFAVGRDQITEVHAYWCRQQLLRRLGVKRFDQVAIV